MLNKSKLLSSMLLLGIIAGASGCGGKNYDLELWTGFGSAYSSAVQDILDIYEAESGIAIHHTSQGSYDGIQTNIGNSLATSAYPDIANGYPDHFAGYISDNIQVMLDDYIAQYNEEHGVNLIDDYYPEYMVENQTLAYDREGHGYTVGLPFNKSTEVITYNSDLVDYVRSLDPTIRLPETWQIIEEDGLKYLQAMDTVFGHRLVGKRAANGHMNEFRLLGEADDLPQGFEDIADYTNITDAEFNLITWDATDNMFITAVRQWGGSYTSFRPTDGRHGYADFWSTGYQSFTRDALTFFYNLYDANYTRADESKSKSHVFAVTDGYNSDAFKLGKVMFNVGSSGGLSHDLATFKIGVLPIPYKDADKKFVISQGTNLAIFEHDDEERKQKAFNAIVEMTTGEIQAQWAVETGYFPSSKSAANSAIYQSLINDPQEDPLRALYQSAAKVNSTEYMDASNGWTKFVDPGFVGSSKIRAEVKGIFAIIFNARAEISSGAKTIDSVINATLDDVYTRIGSTYTRP